MRKQVKVIAAVLMLLCTMAACTTEIDFGIHDPGELTASDIMTLEDEAYKLVAGKSDELASSQNLLARSLNRGKSDDEKIKDDYSAQDFEYGRLIFDRTGYFTTSSSKKKPDEIYLFPFEIRVYVKSENTSAIIYGILEVRNLKKNQAALYADKFSLKDYSLIPPSATEINNVPLTWESIIRAFYGNEVKQFRLPGV